MIKEIKKSEIPEWTYGDVAIKTYSYGDLLSIKDMSEFDGEEIKAKAGYKDSDVGLIMLAAGIHYIRDVEGTGFVIKPNTMTEDKRKTCFNFDVSSSYKLLNEIRNLNKPITEEEKK